MDHIRLLVAKKALNILTENGYEAYIVGGYVRDYLLHLDGDDVDITTNALPSAVLQLFEGSVLTSEEGMCVTASLDGVDDEGNTKKYSFEITTFRIDESSEDHRHSKTLVAKTLKQDLKRRDFTVNALCLNKDLELIDLINGTKDVRNKVIRAIGKPVQRFNEDALRMLRALRFVAKLDFRIERDTFKALQKCSPDVERLSSDRIKNELSNTLNQPYFNKALPVIIKSRVYSCKKYIHKAFSYLYKTPEAKRENFDFIKFYTLSTYLRNGDGIEELNLTKEERKKMDEYLFFIRQLENRQLSQYDLLNKPFESVKVAYQILDITRKHPYLFSDLEDMYNSMSIRKMSDLNVNGLEIRNNLKGIVPLSKMENLDSEKEQIQNEKEDVIEPKYYLDKLVIAVLSGECKNDKESLIKYAKELRENE